MIVHVVLRDKPRTAAWSSRLSYPAATSASPISLIWPLGCLQSEIEVMGPKSPNNHVRGRSTAYSADPPDVPRGGTGTMTNANEGGLIASAWPSLPLSHARLVPWRR